MNERIKELAELAWTYVSDEERTKGELYEADRQRERRDEVFAQMIIREGAKCIDAISTNDISDGNEDWEVIDLALTFAQQKLKEHFGVE